MKNACGKDCEGCAVREVEKCPGCASIVAEGKCAIASCCQEKGHESCSTCTQRTWCPTVRQAVSMSKYRREQEEAAMAADKRNAENAVHMVKWCVPLFWLLLLLEVFGVIRSLFENVPIAYMVLSGIGIVLECAEAYCIWQMRSVTSRYEMAARYVLFATVCSGLVTFLPTDRLPTILALLISVPGAVFSYFGVYHTYNAHAEAVTEIDSDLAEKWEKLWKWNIYALIGIFFAVPLASLLGILSLLILLAAMVAVIVCDVLKLVYLHRMIEAYRWYLS